MSDPRDDDGYVYFVLAPTTGRVKIGFSLDPEKRIRELLTASPEMLKLLGIVAGGRPFESELHRRFAGLRRHGEWFEATAELLTFIRNGPVSRTTVSFRSGLHRQWSLFFSALGIRWRYQPEAPQGLYRPEFHLPGLKLWVGVSEAAPTGETEVAMNRLCRAGDAEGIVLHGSIPTPPDNHTFFTTGWFYTAGDITDIDYSWCECPRCGLIGVEYCGYADRLGCRCDVPRKEINHASKNLVSAYAVARFAGGQP